MKIWLPYFKAGSGTDVFTERLAKTLVSQGCEVRITAFAKAWQYFPWPFKAHSGASNADIVVTNSWNGFAFKRASSKLVTVVHHSVHDPALDPYKSTAQHLFHACLVKPFERRSVMIADQALAVSRYTASKVAESLGSSEPYVIPNAVDTDFFCPAHNSADIEAPVGTDPFRLLFVGNLSARKGADLLPAIMGQLGDDFELRYTAGLRGGLTASPLTNMVPLGRLTDEELRDEYRRADILVFPTRLEGFGYAAVEAMACGTPVVASNCSSLPEIVDDGLTGCLCPVDDVNAFVAAIRDIAADTERYTVMSAKARETAVERFSLEAWGQAYMSLFRQLLAE